MKDAKKIKSQLLDACRKIVNDRIRHAKEAMNAAQEAANEESKSSAGDKYNTGRALMQIETDRHARQLIEAQKLAGTLDLIQIERQYNQVDLGSLVETVNGNYFISISAGKIIIEDFLAFAISTASPIGQQLIGMKVGDQLSFNKKTITINRIT